LQGAYKDQAKALAAARDKLLSTNFGPSDQEAAYRRAAAFTQSKGEFNPGDVSTANADILAQQRAGELQKQQLAAQYGIQGAQAMIGQYGAMGNSLIQRMRIASGEEKAANAQTDKASSAPKTIGATGEVWDPDQQKWVFNPEIAKAQEIQKAQNARDTQAAKYSAMQLNAGQMDPATIDFAATYLHDNNKMPPGFMPRMTNGMINPVTTNIYKRMGELYPGEPASQMVANAGLMAAANSTLKGFSSGVEAKAVNALQTAIAHTQVMVPLIGSLNNTNIQALNAAKNWWASNMQGKPQPNSFEGVRDFVTGEISKAVFPGGGGEYERMALQKQASSASSPDKLNDIVQQWYKLLAGKVTNGFRSQWDVGTGGRFGSFDARLSPETRKALGIQSGPQIVQPAPVAGQHPLVSRWLTQPAVTPPAPVQ